MRNFMARGREGEWASGRKLLAASAFALTFAFGASASAQQAAGGAGKVTYDKWCAGCHGVNGDGAGPSALRMLPRPRNFTLGLFQIRSTPSGALPTDDDMMHVIDEGMPGTAMPGWKEKLSKDERAAVLQYIKTFSPFFKNTKTAPKPLDFGKAPSSNDKAIAEGKKAYEKIECAKCHGAAGRGDGKSAQTMEDDAKHPIVPADLTQNWRFNGGGTAEDIYRRLRTGLDGTPMPSMSDMLESKVITDEQLWDVALYVRSLSPEKAPVVRDVVRAPQVQGAVPTSPDDKAWANAETFYIPVVGQIIVKPRWFAPAVTGVFVQALHNGKELALRLTWDDRSKSPDPAWSNWQGRITAATYPKEGDAASAGPAAAAPAAGATAAGTTAPPAAPAAATVAQPGFDPELASVDASLQWAKAMAPPAPLPDMIALEFPRVIPTGMERPYFLMGNNREPVYLWQWKSDAAGAIEATGKGLGSIEPLAGTSNVSANAVFDHGQWRLVLRRPLVLKDSTNRLQFRTGQAIPMGVFTWDGNNGETGTRSAVSTWYFVYLDQPTPKTVYTTPVVAALLTAGLGFLLVRRAKREQQDGDGATRRRENDTT
jgi:mono/diheme cytochrome c family protein